MKRSVVVLVVCLMAIPLVGAAQRVRVTGTQGEVLGYGWEFDTAREGKASVTLGREVIFLNEALTSASFRKDAEHTLRHILFYSCMPCKVHRRVPGRCPCGQVLVPSFRRDETWRTVGRDADGRLMVHGAAPRACHHGLAPVARKAGPCLEAKPRDKLGRCHRGEECCRAKKAVKPGKCHEPKQCRRLEKAAGAGECRGLEKGRKAGKCRKFRKVHKTLKCVEASMLGRGGEDGKCDTLEQCRKEGKCRKIEKIRKMLRCIEARRCRRLKKCRAMGKTPQACRKDALRPAATH